MSDVKMPAPQTLEEVMLVAAAALAPLGRAFGQMGRAAEDAAQSFIRMQVVVDELARTLRRMAYNDATARRVTVWL